MQGPALTQRLGATPAIVGPQRDAEQLAQLAVEVGHVGLRSGDGADHQIRLGGEALTEQAQGDALAAAGLAGDQGEATFAHQRELDTPQEVLNLGCDPKRLGR